MANQPPLMTGLFPDRDSAELGYKALAERGYEKSDVNLAMSDETRKTHFVHTGTETELGNKAAEGAGVGGAIGGTIGAIAAAVAAVGTSLALPGLGLVIAGPSLRRLPVPVLVLRPAVSSVPWSAGIFPKSA